MTYLQWSVVIHTDVTVSVKETPIDAIIQNCCHGILYFVLVDLGF